ncbi:MAG: toxin-antitoxin system, antitoxin component, Xre family protein [Nitrospirae bacterium]|nr:toxin-antitoxin system, antitoxin component, Xre family protein [Nitrospirota bacterium]MBF0534046.1 toxin-antitoxin system, antitoxin component, Xre family protein [Nitrospirota bacterium]MBF0616205.1 toxin-antitoxin system, antitoxin component, Xre family protein [Nitrospirota bacterium]
MSVKDMIKNEIDKLPEDLLAEVLDYIKIIEMKKEKTLLAETYQELSAPVFATIWNNDEDAVYDNHLNY